MRTILVLTDFSTGARNAADLGFYLAGALQARLLLFHTYELPIEVKVKDSSIYPLEAERKLNHNPDHQLRTEVTRLYQGRNKLPGKNQVLVESCSFRGTFEDGLRFAGSDNGVLLTVAGGHRPSAGLMRKTDHVIQSEQLLDCPLLITPANYKFKYPIKHIVFATDLSPADFKPLGWLQRLVMLLRAELFIGHISLPTFNMSATEETAAGVFMHRMEKLGIPLYAFQNYFSDDIATALSDFSLEKKADVLVLVHKKNNWLKHWLHGSTAAALLSQQELPILLIPKTTV